MEPRHCSKAAISTIFAEENWEDILLQGHNQGGGRRQTTPGAVNNSVPSELKWRLLRILAHLFPVLDALEDREPWLVEQKEAPPPPLDGLSMAAPRFHAYVAGCRGDFHILV